MQEPGTADARLHDQIGRWVFAVAVSRDLVEVMFGVDLHGSAAVLAGDFHAITITGSYSRA
jgi:hypothetical protein